jgi:AraC-like DNA-binding protein
VYASPAGTPGSDRLTSARLAPSTPRGRRPACSPTISAAWSTSSPTPTRIAAIHLGELVGLACASADLRRSPLPSVKAARLQAARAYIIRHLGDPELSAASVAGHLGITPRYLHRLFEDQPETFARFVLTERLTRAHRLLDDPRHDGWSISAIAFDVGFRDLSYFNRTFRRAYGCTPSDVRRGAGT